MTQNEREAQAKYEHENINRTAKINSMKYLKNVIHK